MTTEQKKAHGAPALKTITGNLLDMQPGILVQGCNCQGVMGSGLAKEVRRRYPSVFESYARRHELVGLRLGSIHVCASSRTLEMFAKTAVRHVDSRCEELPDGVVFINAMTQDGYGTDRVHVDYDAVRSAFALIRLVARDFGLPVYVPLIGCGLGGGDWSRVEPRIVNALGHDIDVTLVKL